MVRSVWPDPGWLNTKSVRDRSQRALARRNNGNQANVSIPRPADWVLDLWRMFPQSFGTQGNSCRQLQDVRIILLDWRAVFAMLLQF